MEHFHSPKSSLHGLDCEGSNRLKDGGSVNSSAHSIFSRRGFLLLTAGLASCTAAPPLQKAPVKSGTALKAGSGDRPGLPRGPVPRNPDMALRSDFDTSSGLSFSRVLVSGNYIAMTFDDGPHPRNTPRLLEMLRERNIKATFYLVGRNVDLYPQVVRNTLAEGHEIGNHSYTHRLLSKLSDQEIIADLTRCRDSIQRATGTIPRTMRPPYGGLNLRQRQLVRQDMGYPCILWSVDPLDWKRPGATVVTSRILRNTTKGGIILAHDIHSQSVDAMPATLDGLLRSGFKFVTVSQLIAMKVSASAPQVAAASTL